MALVLGGWLDSIGLPRLRVFHPMKRIFKSALAVLNGLVFAGWLIAAPTVFAAVALPAVFSDHAVLQRDRPLPVWGTAAPDETIEVSLGDLRAKTVADSTGKWRVLLPASSANPAPSDLIVRGSNVVTIHDLLIGDVWLCSGQSNMEKPIGEKRDQKPVFHAEEELRAGDHPLIRLLKIPKVRASVPAADVSARWIACSPESLEQTKFSATGYFFGRKIQEEIKVPIGLIDSTWGGTRIELWTPPGAFAAFPSLAELATAARTEGAKAEGAVPSTLYYGMVQPLAPFALRGVLWYQGESNLIDVNDSARYPDKMEALIRGWREVWQEADLPFYYVQIAPHFYHVIRRQVVISPESEAEFWEAQVAALRIPHTGMAVTTDLVDDLFDIHPRNKQDVGLRLALLALARTYGRADVIDSGPVFRRAAVEGNRLKLFFNYAGTGLASRDSKPLSWFTIAGPDGQFFPALVEIEGDHLFVSSPHVAHPAKVRFAWDEAAQPNFVNSAGLPAQPFRTDSPFPIVAVKPRP